MLSRSDLVVFLFAAAGVVFLTGFYNSRWGFTLPGPVWALGYFDRWGFTLPAPVWTLGFLGSFPAILVAMVWFLRRVLQYRRGLRLRRLLGDTFDPSHALIQALRGIAVDVAGARFAVTGWGADKVLLGSDIREITEASAETGLPGVRALGFRLDTYDAAVPSIQIAAADATGPAKIRALMEVMHEAATEEQPSQDKAEEAPDLAQAVSALTTAVIALTDVLGQQLARGVRRRTGEDDGLDRGAGY